MLCEKMELELQTVTVDGIIHQNDKKDWTTTNSGNIRKQKKMDLYVVKQAVAG